jgi:hypothetical protein
VNCIVGGGSSFNSMVGGQVDCIYCNASYTTIMNNGNVSMGSSYSTAFASVNSNSYSAYNLVTFSGAVYQSANSSSTTFMQNVVKSGGSFEIEHPDPAKSDTMLLIHSFVEAPTAGENIYRYKITTENCSAVLELPDYYKYLNCNEHISLSPINNFGNGYGLIDETQSCVNFTTDTDGEYDVLIIGTRKDKDVQFHWKGVERYTNDSRTK